MKRAIVLLALALFCIPGTLAARTKTYTTTYVYAGGHNCLAVVSQDGIPIAANAGYVCFQTSAFDTAPGFSLYLPGNPNPAASGYPLILEGGTISYGPEVIVDGDGGAGTILHRLDTFNFSGFGWRGSLVENLLRTAHTCCGRFGCRTCYLDDQIGGTGAASITVKRHRKR